MSRLRLSTVAFAATLALFAAPAGGQDLRSSMLVSTSWLADHLEDPSLVLLHVGDRKEYEGSFQDWSRRTDWTVEAQADRKTAPGVAGKWVMTLEMSMGTATPVLELKQDATKITGTYTGRYGTFALQGSLKDNVIQFSFTMGAEGETVTMSFVGEVSADGQAMKGTASLGEMGDATWSAKRQ